MTSSSRPPGLMANVVLAAVILGVIAGVSLRARSGGGDDPAPVGRSAPVNVVAAQATQTAPPAQRLPFSPQMFSFADVAEHVAPAVVTVVSQRPAGSELEGLFGRFFRGDESEEPLVQGHGSGFILAADGVVITNNHVVEGSDALVVRLQDGREFDATVVGTDAATDIAVLRIAAAGLPTIALGNSDAMRVGDWVLAIGSPFRQQLDHSVSAGIISGKGRGNVGLAEYEEFLQTDAAINPGNSGGPLVNLAGEVIGINTAIATRTGTSAGVSFAIPINFAHRIVNALLENGRVTRAWMGIQIRDVDQARARELNMERPEGVVVAEVYKDMPADRAGLRTGDVILAVDGQPTSDVALFRNRVSLSRPGQKVKLEILRDSERQTVSVELGELNDDALARAGVPPRGGREPDVADPELGLELSEITPQLARRFDLSERADGLVIVDVARGSVAAEAGLEPGDVVRSVNRKRVESLTEFDAAVADLPADHPVVLQVRRGSRSFFVTLERSS